MKKLALTLLVLVVVIALAVPFYSGKKAHEALDNLVAQINFKKPGAVSWETYQQGWFQSHAVLRINLSSYLPANTVDAAATIPVQVDLYHGPFIFDQGFEFGWFKSRLAVNGDDPELKKMVQVEGAGPIALSVARVTLGGVVSSSEMLLPMTVTTGDSEWKLGGFQGSGVYIPLGALTYKAQIPSASMKSGQQQLLFDGAEVSLRSELKSVNGAYVIPGDVNVRVKTINALNGNEQTFVLEDSALSSALSIAQPYLAADIQLRLSVGRAAALGDAVTDIVGDLEVQHLSLAFYQKYVDLIRSSAGAPLPGMQVLSLVNQELIPLGPEVVVKQMSFTAPEGKMTVSGFLRVPPSTGGPQTNPFAALGLINAEINMVADKPITYRLLELNAADSVDRQMFASGKVLNKEQRDAAIKENAAAQVNLLVLQHYWVDKGNTFESKISLEKGKAIINGQIIPLPF